MFDRGDIVKTDEAVARTGKVRTQLASGQYQVCFDAEETDCALFDEAQLTLVKEEGVVVLPTTSTIVPEDAAMQQAKQQASLSKEELAQLEAEHQAALDRQAAQEARMSTLSLEGLAGEIDALTARVEALETPVLANAVPAQDGGAVYPPEQAPVIGSSKSEPEG